MPDATAPTSALTQETFDQYLKNPILFPEAFKDWISDWYAQNVPKLHVSQIFGFKLQSINVADVVSAAESASANSAYGEIGMTHGPEIVNLANGFYVVMFGATAVNSGSIGVSVDGAVPSGVLSMSTGAIVSYQSIGRMALVDISTGDNNHSLVMQYLTGGIMSVKSRWLHALKVVTEDA